MAAQQVEQLHQAGHVEQVELRRHDGVVVAQQPQPLRVEIRVAEHHLLAAGGELQGDVAADQARPRHHHGHRLSAPGRAPRR